MLTMWMWLGGACVAPPEGERLAPLPVLAPAVGFDEWRAMPPPPLALCARGMAVLNGVAYPHAAVAAAASSPRDTIWMCPGVHTESIRFRHAGPIAVAGMTGVAADVIVDGAGFTLPWLSVQYFTAVQVRNLYFTGFERPSSVVMNVNKGEAGDISNVAFEWNPVAVMMMLHQTPWMRVRDVESTGNRSQTLHVRYEPWALSPSLPPQPGMLIVDNLLIQDNVASTNEGIAITANYGPVPFGADYALRAEVSDLVIEGGDWPSIPITVIGDSYWMDFYDLQMRDVVSVGSPLDRCPFDPLVWFSDEYTTNRTVVNFYRPVFEDNVASSVIKASFHNSTLPLQRQTRIDQGRIVRNQVCEGALYHPYGGIAIRDTDFGLGADDNIPYDAMIPCHIVDDVPAFGLYRASRVPGDACP